jgi:hypothetical protein
MFGGCAVTVSFLIVDTLSSIVEKIGPLQPGVRVGKGAACPRKSPLGEGKPEAALELAQEGDEADGLSILPMALQAIGRQAEVDESLKALIRKFVGPDTYSVTINYAYRTCLQAEGD